MKYSFFLYLRESFYINRTVICLCHHFPNLLQKNYRCHLDVINVCKICFEVKCENAPRLLLYKY